MLYNPPSGSSDANAPYVGKDVASGRQGSKLPPAAAEYPQRELVALIAASGQAPTNTVLVQAAMALSRGIFVGNLTGTGDLSVATLGVVLPSLLQGMKIGAVATAANATTAPKLRVANLGSAAGTIDFPIIKEDGSALAVGEIKAGRRYRYEADGAGNVMISGGGIALNGLTASVYFGFATGTNALASNVLPAPTTLIDGMLFEIVPANYNTGAVTLAINGMPALPVRYRDINSEMLPGEFQLNATVLLMKFGNVFVLMSPPNPLRSSSFYTSYTGAQYATSNNVAALFPMTAGTSGFGYHDGNQFNVTRPGLYVISATASTGINTSGPANVNSQVIIFRNGTVLPGGAGRAYDNAYDSSGVIAPTVSTTAILQLAAGDAISVWGIAYASANYISSSNNTASLQIAALN